MKKATLNISDVHYGDAGQLYDTWQATLGEVQDRLVAFGPDETEVVLNGDLVAGRGIFRGQEAQNILQLGAEQCWFAAWDLRQFDLRLRKAGVNVSRWILTLGNHDNTNRENLAAQVVAVLRLLDVPVYYAGRTFTGNFAADEREGMWYEAEHGFGGSDYYANSYSEIRAMWRKYVERSKVDHINLSRMLLGHTHWLNVGQVIGHDLAIDTTGGWHRQERLKLAADVRDTGCILYLHDGETLDIQEVRADRKLLLAESREVGLHYKTMAAAARALGEATAWAHASGLL